MFKSLTVFVVLAASILVADAGEAVPAIANRGKTVAELVPLGWVIEGQSIGDLNGDGRPDAVIVLCKTPAAKSNKNRCVDAVPKIVAVAFRDQGDGYSVVAQSHTLIPSGAQVGDVVAFNENGLSIRRGSFRLRLDFMRGNTTFTFRFRDGGIKLIGYDRVGATAVGDSEEISINFLTGDVRRAVGRTDQMPSKDKISRRKLSHKPLAGLDEIGDGALYRPIP